MVSFKEFLIEGGVGAERQERGVIDAINRYAKKGPISVNQIKNVSSAEKMEGINELGTEPYTDVILTIGSGQKRINVSLKGGTESGVSAAPSVGGGGLVGLQTLIPDITKRFLINANTWYKKQGFKKGDLIPDVYGRLNEKDTLTVLKGTPAMGGPVDYMYIGPMDVVGAFKGDQLTLNGVFSDIKQYAKGHSIFLRLRKRREDQPYEPDLKDKDGNPLILGKSPTKGDSGRRIVLVDRVPASGNIVEI